MNDFDELLATLRDKIDASRVWKEHNEMYALATSALRALAAQPEIHDYKCVTALHPQNTSALQAPCTCWQVLRRDVLAQLHKLSRTVGD